MTTSPGNVLRTDGPAHLGAVLGEGGEGAVYRVTDKPLLAAKVYREPDLERGAKLMELVALDGDRLRQAGAWPQSLLTDESGAIVGFEMELLDGWVPLFRVYQPGSRLRLLPRATFAYLVRAAKNLATCVHYVHEAGLVIGDLNESNVLVDARGMVRIIDVDSFQIGGFDCRVGKGELTPPELQDMSMAEGRRNKASDLFALAVLVFQTLVFGRHPYSGTSRDGSEASLERRIAEGHYTWSQEREVPVKRPLNLDLDWLTTDVRSLFERAFRTCPDQRPTALEWHEALSRLEEGLSGCDVHAAHVYCRDLGACPWCRLEEAWRVSLFPSGRPRRERKRKPPPDVGEIWAPVAAVRPPFLVPPPSVRNYDETEPQKLKWFENSGNTVSIIFVSSQIFSVFYRDALLVMLLVSLPIGIITFLVAGSRAKASGRKPPKPAEFKVLATDINVRLAEWRQLTEERYAKAFDELVEIRRKLTDRHEREAKIQAEVYFTNRPGELKAYLSKFALVASGLLTESSRPLFESEGIRTAADIDEQKLASINDIDAPTRRKLFEWRTTLVQHYFATCSAGLTDEEAESVELKLQAEDGLLAQRLRSAPAELEQLKDRLVSRQREIAEEVQPLLDRYEAMAPRFHAYVKASLIKIEKPWTYYVDHGPQKPTLNVSPP